MKKKYEAKKSNTDNIINNKFNYTIMKIKVPEWLIAEKAKTGEKIYLSDFMKLKDMHNTVFNKSVTGIGGTSLALDSDENIIILMPFKEVVNNKDGYNSDVFIVKGGITIAQIVKYLKSATTRKIVSTYDGLKKIMEAYIKAKIDIADDFLLVDEWQVLFNQYIFRNPVMKYLLNNIKIFKKVCFMTATPIKSQYWFNEIKHLQELELDYNLPEVEVRHFQAANIKDEALSIIKLHKEDRNLHLFCNSVDFIKDVVKAGNIKPEDVRIVCSQDDKNKLKLSGYKIETTKHPVKRINFYTSTCFEGCDIYDTNGKIYVFSDGTKAHTLVDISTTLPQIAGRIRNIKDGSIDLIYRNSRYIDVTPEQFNISVELNKSRAKEILAEWKKLGDVLDVDKLNGYYLGVEKHIEKDPIRNKDKEIIDYVEFDEALLNLEQHNFEVHNTYSLKANLISELSMSFKPVTVVKPWADQLVEVEKEKINKMSFKEKVQTYIDITSNETVFSIIPEFDKVVVNAVKLLGIKRIEELNYHKGDIEKALIAKSDITESNKIAKLLHNYGFTTGTIKTNKECKAILSDIYKELGIKKAAAATHILKYYDVVKTKIDKENKKEDGYKIIRPLTIFK